MGLTIGQAIWVSVKPIIKIYLIIGTGFFLAKTNILTVAASRTLSDIVLTVLLPSLSFNKIVGSIEDSDIKDVGIICLTAVLIFGTGLFFAYVLSKLLPVPKEWRGGILAGGMFPNISDLPIAILQTMDQGGLVFSEKEGDKGVASVIIFLAMFMICLFNLGGFRLVEMDFHYNDEENATTDSGSDVQQNVQGSVSGQLSQFNIPLGSPSESFREKDPEANSRNSMPNGNDSSSVIDPIVSPPVQLGEEDLVTRRYTNTTQNTAHSVAASLRSIDLRELPAQNINDLIREYSNVDQFGTRRGSVASSFKVQPPQTKRDVTKLSRIVTSDATVRNQDIKDSGKVLPEKIRKIPGMNILLFFLKNCLRPCSMAVLVALIIAFIPWVKALFVTTDKTPNMKQAPDGLPPLNFIMDYTNYLGSASVPFGLMLLGATLGRLKIKKLYPGFWKTAVCLVILRQCVMPIFGVLWCDRLVKAGWLSWEKDSMLLLVIVIDWGLPTMTTIIYFTASFTPPDAVETVQMDCVAFFLMLQYPLLIISMPFLVTYFLMVQMKV